MNKNRKFAADGDIFTNNFSNTLFKPCFSGKSRSCTSLFVCVVTVTGVAVRKSFPRLIVFFVSLLNSFSLHGTSEEEDLTQTTPRRLHPERQRQDEMAAGENHRSGRLRADLPRYDTPRLLVPWSLAEAVCTRTGRWMELNRLVM